MWRFFLISCAFFQVSGDQTPFVFGGTEVNDARYNFMIYIEYWPNPNGYNLCSGGLIGDKWILTAAHCFEKFVNKEKVKMVAGQTRIWNERVDFRNKVKISAKNIYIHEEYDFDDDAALDNDIALIELDKPFVLDVNINKINYSREKIQSDIICTVLGFGLTEHNTTGVLYHIPKTVIFPPDTCQTARPNTPLNNHFACLFKRTEGVCEGDSGGPLLCNGEIYALSTASTLKNCTRGGSSYFLMVEPYHEWIQEKITVQTENPTEGGPNLPGVIAGVVCVIIAMVIAGVAIWVFKFKKDKIKDEQKINLAEMSSQSGVNNKN